MRVCVNCSELSERLEVQGETKGQRNGRNSNKYMQAENVHVQKGQGRQWEHRDRTVPVFLGGGGGMEEQTQKKEWQMRDLSVLQ